jgi:hypothetical protein
MAGEGVRPLEGEAIPDLGPPPAAGAAMALPKSASSTRRTRIDVPPPANRVEVGEAPAAPAGAWQRREEVSLERRALSPALRTVVGRYFQQPADGG